jgi:hypothetical protein
MSGRAQTAAAGAPDRAVRAATSLATVVPARPVRAAAPLATACTLTLAAARRIGPCGMLTPS